MLHHSITPADCGKRGKSIEAPSGGSPKPGPSPHSGIFDGPGFFTLKDGDSSENLITDQP